jgi:hypothetical protein
LLNFLLLKFTFPWCWKGHSLVSNRKHDKNVSRSHFVNHCGPWHAIVTLLNLHLQEWSVIGRLPFRIKTTLVGYWDGWLYFTSGQRDKGPKDPSPKKVVGCMWRTKLHLWFPLKELIWLSRSLFFFGYITFSIPPWWASYFLVIIGEMGGFEDCHIMPLPPVCCMFILLVIIP